MRVGNKTLEDLEELYPDEHPSKRSRQYRPGGGHASARSNMCTAKSRYGSEEEAKEARLRIVTRLKSVGKTADATRIYKCSFCPGWHLTKQDLFSTQEKEEPVSEEGPSVILKQPEE